MFQSVSWFREWQEWAVLGIVVTKMLCSFSKLFSSFQRMKKGNTFQNRKIEMMDVAQVAE